MIGTAFGTYNQKAEEGAYEFAQALEFDGVDDYVDLPFNFSSAAFTISFWFNTSTLIGIKCFLGGDNNNYFRIRNGLSRFTARFNAVAECTFDFTPLLINTWYHVYVSGDGLGDVRVFVNANESDSKNITTVNAPIYNKLGVQYPKLIQYFDGKMDDVTLTNTAVADPQAAATAIYNGGAGADPLITFPTAQQLYRFNNNANNDGSLGGVATLNNFIADPYVERAYEFAQALEFDGVDDFVDIVTPLDTNTLTVAFWFKLPDLLTKRYLGGESTINWLDIRASTNTINIRWEIGGVNFTIPALAINTWYHLLVSSTSGTARVFIDGVESVSGAQSVNGVCQYRYIGRQGLLYYSGILDDILITPTAAADPQAAATAIYNGGAGADPLITLPTAEQLYRFNNNANNDGSLGGVATNNGATFVPHI